MSDSNQQNLYTDYRQLWQMEGESFEELVAQSDRSWAEATATEEGEAMAVFGDAALPVVDYAALWKQPNTGAGDAASGMAGITIGEGQLAENPLINFKIRERESDDAPTRRWEGVSVVIPKDGGCF